MLKEITKSDRLRIRKKKERDRVSKGWNEDLLYKVLATILGFVWFRFKLY